MSAPPEDAGSEPRALAELTLRIEEVRARITSAAVAAGRAADAVTLIGVTKTHPVGTAALALEAGLVDLAENRVGELTVKVEAVPLARWHLIGRLQRNKVREVVGRAALVHSVDRVDLAEAISRRATARGLVQAVLVQVNVGDDPAKGGCSLAEAAGLVAYARELPGVRVEGLMTVPPLPPSGVAALDGARPHFSALREVRDRLGTEPAPGSVAGATEDGLHLSMGMSEDLEAAVAEGATMVRVGTALFGRRPAVVATEDGR